MIDDPNLEILEHVASRLGSLVEEVVFLGGCATGLLITDPAAPSIRVSNDVDVIIEVASYAAYNRIAHRLRQLGFVEDASTGAPLCRWLVEQVRLDVMPTDARILGFGNRWYKPAIASATSVTLPSGQMIRVVSAPYFVATKLEAFHGRGEGDYLGSHDLEDLVAVVDGRPELISEVQAHPTELRTYLAGEIGRLLNDPRFQDALPGHLPGDPASQARLSAVHDRLLAISAK